MRRNTQQLWSAQNPANLKTKDEGNSQDHALTWTIFAQLLFVNQTLSTNMFISCMGLEGELPSFNFTDT